MLQQKSNGAPCPCGSEREYEACCGSYIQGGLIPQHPEQLMRSRYTAYTQANIDYIIQTMCGAALKGFNAVEASAWATSVQWMELKVLNASETGDEGVVEYAAYFVLQNQMQELRERSHFVRQNGRWFYDGELKLQKIGRNDPCSCGSGKKYKKCCGAR